MVKKIFTLRLAKFLCDGGCKMIRTEPNRDKPWLNVYVFEVDDNFNKLMAQYKQG